jgi:hypothetical protein
LTAFEERESVIRSGRTPDECGAGEIKGGQIAAVIVKASSISSSDSFNLSRSGLKTLGLDLR